MKHSSEGVKSQLAFVIRPTNMASYDKRYAVWLTTKHLEEIFQNPHITSNPDWMHKDQGICLGDLLTKEEAEDYIVQLSADFGFEALGLTPDFIGEGI